MTQPKPPPGWTDQQEQHVKLQAETGATSWESPVLFTNQKHRLYAARRFFIYNRRITNQRRWNAISPTKPDDNMKSPTRKKPVKPLSTGAQGSSMDMSDVRDALVDTMKGWRTDDGMILADVSHGTKNQNGAITQVIKNLTREENNQIIMYSALLVVQFLKSMVEIPAAKGKFRATLEDCLVPTDLRTPTSAIHLNAPNGSSMLKASKGTLVKKVTENLKPYMKKADDLKVSVDIAVDALISSAVEHGTWSTFVTTLPDPNELPDVTHGNLADESVPLKYSAKYINGSNEDNAIIPLLTPLDLSKVVKQADSEKLMKEKTSCVMYIIAIEGTESIRCSASTPVAARDAEANVDLDDWEVSSPPAVSSPTSTS